MSSESSYEVLATPVNGDSESKKSAGSEQDLTETYTGISAYLKNAYEINSNNATIITKQSCW